MSISSDGKINEVFGGLYGVKNSSKKMEIFYSIEFLNTNKDHNTLNNFDLDFIKSRKELSDHLFSNQNYELIGYFLTSPKKLKDANPKNEEILKVMSHFSIKNPICLILSTDIENENNLPISIFSLNSSTEKFENFSHKIEGNDSERITLDTVMKYSENSAKKESKNSQNLNTFKNALDVLQQKLKEILVAGKSEKFKNDEKFRKMLDEIISNVPKFNDKEMERIIDEKNYENSIMNCINVSVFNKICVKNEEKNKKFKNYDEIMNIIK